MNIISNIKKLKLKESAVTIGKFDGVHRGHDSLLSMLKNDPLTKVVFTFDAKKGTPLEAEGSICSNSRKIELLAKYEPDYIIFFRFGRLEAAMSPRRFVKSLLVKRLGMKRIYVGPDFRFGRKGKGDIALLKELGTRYGFEVVVHEKVTYDGKDISSTRIRNEIKEGHYDKAYAMLGHTEDIEKQDR